MKRSLLILFLALCLSLALWATPAMAEGRESFEIVSLDIAQTGGGTWSALAQVNAPEDCVLAVAVYDGADGAMLGCWQQTLTGCPETADVEMPLKNYAGNGKTARGFLLGKSSWTPLCSLHLLITAGGVEIRNGSFQNVTVSASVGDGHVTLNQVNIRGNLFVKGGGENTIVITNRSNVGNVLVRKTASGGIRLLAEEGARVDAVVVEDGKDGVILEGEFNQVSVDTMAPVILRNAQVTGLTVNAEEASVSLVSTEDGQTRVSAAVLTAQARNSSLDVGGGSAVAALTAQAQGTAVSGGGTVTAASVSGDGTRIGTEGTLVSVKPGTKDVTHKDQPVESASDAKLHPVQGANAIALSEDGKSAVVTYADGAAETIALTPVRSAEELAALWTGEGEEAVISANVAILPGSGILLSQAAKEFIGLDFGPGDAPNDPPVPASYPAVRMSAGTFFVIAPGASVTADCALEVEDGAVFAEGQLALEEQGYLQLLGGYGTDGTAVLINDGTLTVRRASAVECLGGGAALVNNGLLRNLGSLGVYTNAQLVNNGTLLNGEGYRDDSVNLWLMGTRLINSPGALLVNCGSLGGQHARNLYSRNRNADEETQLLRNTPPALALVNEGLLTDSGYFWMHGGTVENSGAFLISRDGSLDIQPGFSTDWHLVLEEKDISDLKPGDADRLFDYAGAAASLIVSSEYRNTAVRYSVWANSGVLSTEDGGYFHFAGSFDNSGTVNNGGEMDLWTADFHTLEEIWFEDGDPGALEGLRPAATALTNTGTFNNGPAGPVGENENSHAYLRLNGLAAHNAGVVNNNGNSDWFGVSYTQTAGGVFETYNSRGMGITACQIHIPAGSRFHDQGYLAVIDQYGVEPDSSTPDRLSDLSGWADFEKLWGDPNGSRWADYEAQVFSRAGYDRAVAAQQNGAGYTRLDFCADMTLENERFGAFPQYWVNGRRFGDAEGEYGWTTLTLAGNTTVAAGARLHIDGDYWWNRNSGEYVAAGGNVVLARDASLLLEPGRGRDGWQDSAGITVWGVGSLNAKDGKILTPWNDDQGEFPACVEVYYEDFLRYDPDMDSEFYQGYMEHVGELEGLPEETCNVADARLPADLREAANNDMYRRAAIRRDSVIELTENLTLPARMQNLYIEPGSGLTVEEGATLRLELDRLNNQGDMHVYGTVLQGAGAHVENNQYLEIGSVTGGQRGKWEVRGELFNRGSIHVYALGELAVAGDGRMPEGPGDMTQDEGAAVDLGKWHFDESFSEDVTVAAEAIYEGSRFEKNVTVDLSALPAGSRIEFNRCDFRGEVTILRPERDEPWEAEVLFCDNCSAGSREKLPVTVLPVPGAESGGSGGVFLNGADGLNIRALAPVWVSSGNGSYRLNGVTVSGEGAAAVLYERDGQGEPRPVFQVDGGDVEDSPLTLKGSVEGFDQLRLMQGYIDISGLEADENPEITVSDMWRFTHVNAGKHSLHLWENSSEAETHGGFSIIAEAGAEIFVHDGFMSWDGERQDYGYSTGVAVEIGEDFYYLNPHIFGAAHDSPAVYIGTGDQDVDYTLRSGDDVYEEYVTEYLTDAFTVDGEERQQFKTHLTRAKGKPWFEASQYSDPRLELTVELPQGVTVVFDPVPVKPEWMDPREAQRE